jgi:hypothetical protein
MILELALETDSTDQGSWSDGYPDTFIQGFPGPFYYQFNSVPAYGGPVGYRTIGGWFRFRLPVDGNATINSAVIKLITLDTVYVGALQTVNVKFVGYDADDPTAPISNTDASNRFTVGPTSASYTVNVPYGTPNTVMLFDITNIIREIIQRGGWANNNHVLIMYNSQLIAGTTSTSFNRSYYGASTGHTNDPVIEINYDPPIHPADADKEVEHTLTITQFVNLHSILKSTEHTLTIEQDMEGHLAWVRTVENRVTFTQDILSIISGTFDKSVESLVIVSDFWTVNKGYLKDVENVIDITHESQGNTPLSKHPFHTITFEQDI